MDKLLYGRKAAYTLSHATVSCIGHHADSWIPYFVPNRICRTEPNTRLPMTMCLVNVFIRYPAFWLHAFHWILIPRWGPPSHELVCKRTWQPTPNVNPPQNSCEEHMCRLVMPNTYWL